MNFRRTFGYVLAFCLATALCFAAVALFLALIIGMLMFITLSLPVASPFSWVIFRILLLISMVFATVFCFSKEAKEFVDDFEEDN